MKSVSDELVLYCIVSEEAVKASNGCRGKMASQAGHAFVGALIESIRIASDRAMRYINSDGVPKVTLIGTQEQLQIIFNYHSGIHGAVLVKDAGRTVFKEPMITAAGIGPITRNERCALLQELRPWQ